MPRFDYQCPKCGNIVEMSAPHWAGVECLPCCMMPGCFVEKAPTTMEKLPAAPNFTIKGFNAGNRYSK